MKKQWVVDLNDIPIKLVPDPKQKYHKGDSPFDFIQDGEMGQNTYMGYLLGDHIEEFNPKWHDESDRMELERRNENWTRIDAWLLTQGVEDGEYVYFLCNW
jgi:hypothetical protein